MSLLDLEFVNEPDIQPEYKRKLINLVEEARKVFTDDIIRKYRELGVAPDELTGKPERPAKVPFWDKVFDSFEPDAGTLCLIPVLPCRGDASYNRSLEIHYKNIQDNLDYQLGFSYSAANVIEVVYVRSTGEFIVTKGQHRVVAAWLALGDTATIVANVKIVDDEYSEEDQIKAEASRHHVDAQKVSRQKAHQSGLSGYVAGDKEEVKYTEWILSRGVGVKGKMHLFPNLKFDRVCDTPWAVKSAISINETNCSAALRLLDKYLPSQDKIINGKSIKAVTTYLTILGLKLEKTARINHTSVELLVDEIFSYVFKERKIKTAAWLKGSNALRGENITIPLARLIRFTNSYCLERDLKLPDGRKNEDSAWCSVNEGFWVDFLNKTTPKELQGSVNAILTEC